MVTKQIKGTKQLLIRLHVNRMVDDKNIIPDREGCTGKESIVYRDVTSKNTVSTPAKILH